MTAQPQATDPSTWVERHGDILYRYALARLRNPTLAEEAVQDTFLSALKARGTFSGKSSEQTWLVGILKHKIIDQFRKLSREQPLGDAEPADVEVERAFDADGHWIESRAPAEWGTEAERSLEQAEFRQALDRCLAGLSKRSADAFVLRELEELSTEDICKVLNVTATNLWVLLHRARTQLRRCLEQNWIQPGARSM
jgi:RNA polymerase sigma-70 factor (ECF subfamily)